MRWFIILGLFLVSGLTYGNDFNVDKSKSYLVATVVGSNAYRRDRPYYKDRYYNNRYYKRRYYNNRYYQKRYKPAKRYIAPRMTDEKRIQIALAGLGYYYGSINGAINQFETRSAIKKMNNYFGLGDTASLDTRTRDNLIFLGLLFSFNEHLTSSNSGRYVKNKKIQTALKIKGFYHSRVDGVSGSGTRRAISEYKRDMGLYGSSLNYEEEYQLIEGAKKENDKNMENIIASFKNINQ